MVDRMPMRLVLRLCHFIIYAYLFITRLIGFKMTRMRNSLTWLVLLAQNRF